MFVEIITGGELEGGGSQGYLPDMRLGPLVIVQATRSGKLLVANRAVVGRPWH